MEREEINLKTLEKLGLIAIGETVRHYRRVVRNISMEKLAEEADISPDHLGRIERAEKSPHYTTMFKICSALELDMNDINKRIHELVHEHRDEIEAEREADNQ